MDLNAKKIVQKSLSLDQVELSDVEMMSEKTVKNLVAGLVTKATISTLPLSIKLLQGLNALMRKLIFFDPQLKLSRSRNSNKIGLPTLAFMDE